MSYETPSLLNGLGDLWIAMNTSVIQEDDAIRSWVSLVMRQEISHEAPVENFSTEMALVDCIMWKVTFRRVRCHQSRTISPTDITGISRSWLTEAHAVKHQPVV
jgi:hypothetical protein